MAKEDKDAPQGVIGVDVLAAALKQVLGNTDEDLKKKAAYDAEATRKALHPENTNHPAVSVFNPEGERDHPKPPLPCEVFWLNDPQDNEKITPEENRLFAVLERKVFESGFTDVNTQGQPCKRFNCKKLDGSRFVVEVSGVRGEQKLLRMLVMFPANRDARQSLPSIAEILRQMTGEPDPRDRALEELARLREQVAAASR